MAPIYVHHFLKFLLIKILIFKILFIYLKGIFTERKGQNERKVFYLLVLSPNDVNDQGSPIPRPRSRNSIRASHVGSRVWSTWDTFCFYLRHISRKLDLKLNSQVQTMAHGSHSRPADNRLIYYTKMPARSKWFYSYLVFQFFLAEC